MCLSRRLADQTVVLQHIGNRALNGEILREQFRRLDARHVARHRSGIENGDEPVKIQPLAIGEVGCLDETRHHGDQEQVYRELHEKRIGDGAAVDGAVTHRGEERLNRCHVFLLPCQHRDELCFLRGLARAGDRRLDVVAARGADIGL